MQLTNSPVSEFTYSGRTFYIKRDDLLAPEFSGNKARKLAYLLQHDYPKVNTLISLGGYQSNLMYALSQLAKLKGWRFIYYSKKVAETAYLAKTSNLQASLENGMELRDLSPALHAQLMTVQQPHELFIPQGGALASAAWGIEQLAEEISLWAQGMNFPQVAVFVASGTGATAGFLQKYLTQHKVYTTNCVASVDYLIAQIQALDLNPLSLTIFPNTQWRFAYPTPELWQTVSLIKAVSNIEFDLVYDPIGWNILLANLAQITLPIIYLHCGGTMGNLSMEGRYQRLLNS